MMFYSEIDGSTPGKALAIGERWQFPPLENTMCSGTKIEVTTESLKETTVDEEDRI